MSTPSLDVKCEILRELQRDLREEPFFAELFGTRDTGFRAASSGVAVDALTPISVEQVEWSWSGLCELLDVPVDIDVETVDDLLEASDAFDY